MYSMNQSDMELEGMFSVIASANGIRGFRFVYYQAMNDYDIIRLMDMEKDEANSELEKTIVDEMIVSPDYFSTGKIDELIDGDILSANKLGVCSDVNIPRRFGKYCIKHIDFDCEPGDDNIAKVERELYELGAGPGWIVYSGNSYHFHGREVIDFQEWLNFMNNVKIKSEEDSTIDHSFAIISQIRDYSVLRVAKSYDKQEPQVIYEIK